MALAAAAAPAAFAAALASFSALAAAALVTLAALALPPWLLLAGFEALPAITPSEDTSQGRLGEVLPAEGLEANGAVSVIRVSAQLVCNGQAHKSHSTILNFGRQNDTSCCRIQVVHIQNILCLKIKTTVLKCFSCKRITHREHVHL